MGSDASVRFAYHAIRVERVKKVLERDQRTG